MIYRFVQAQFVNACDALYPGDYEKDQLASIFKDNVSHIIEATRSNQGKYIDYCKTLVVNRDNLIDVSTIQSFQAILVRSEEDTFTDEDRLEYIDTFIKRFLESFPGIYTYNELFHILDINVKTIILDNLSLNKYLPDQRKIVLNHRYFDSIIFHEFIHAIRGDLIVRFHGIDEGLTELFTLIEDQKVGINEVDYSKSAYRDLVKVVIKLCNKYPTLLNDYITRKDVVRGLLEDDFDIVCLLEELYDLYDEDYTYKTKEEMRDLINIDIEKAYTRKKRG